MTRQSIIKAIAGGAAICAVLAVVLCVHIYMVTTPKADEHTIAMARIDFKQDINQEDADKITAWLYQQKGVDHVFINTKTETAVFTFYPVKVSADQIAQDLRSTFHYKAERFMPSAKDLKSGCPVSSKTFFN
jgi:hypothetical protein